MIQKVSLSVLVILSLSITVAKAKTDEKHEAASKGTDEVPAVAVEQTPAQSTGQVMNIRAQLKARQSTLISSEMGGHITQLRLRDGERFTRGQTLVEFNCAVEAAQLSKARVILDNKNKAYEVNQRLAELKAISPLDESLAKTEADKAKADMEVVQAVWKRCSIQAPFSGKVVEMLARPYQSVRAGDPLMEILDDNNLEVEFMAPSDTASELKSGKRFRVTLDETGKTYTVEIIRIDGKVDAVSQASKVYGRITDKSSELLPGMSGTISMPAIK